MVTQIKELLTVDNVKVKITLLDYKLILQSVKLTEKINSLEDIIVYCKNTKN